MIEKLDKIEARLRTLIEGNTYQLLPPRNLLQKLIHEIVQGINTNRVTLSDGRIIAPFQFIIHINPSDNKSWISKQDFLEDLTESLKVAVQDAGLFFSNPPIIRLIPDLTLMLDQFQIEIAPSSQAGSDTVSMHLPITGSESQIENAIFLLSAFLIVNSTFHFHLEHAIINIGRRSDNQLIINDPRISRVHCQLRLVNKHFILFDLNSKGGTFVNGQRISQYTLSPGDVISLMGVPLVYGENPHPELSNTESITVKQSANSQTKTQPILKSQPGRE
jgi:hypothetical protein